MAKPELTQDELPAHYDSNEVIILSFRTAYEVKYSHGVNGYILQQIRKTYADLPYTKRGRYMAFSPERAAKVMS